MPPHVLSAVIEQLSDTLGFGLTLRASKPESGGSFSRACQLDCGDHRFFVKYQTQPPQSMFETEAEGLREIAQTESIRVPQALAVGNAEGIGFIAMEYLDLYPRSEHSDYQLGRALATLHLSPQPYFGWRSDNYCGLTPQPNPHTEHWWEFFVKQRILYQTDLLCKHENGMDLTNEAQQVVANLDRLFEGYQPQASLVHGDLWSGNASATEDDVPVVFDPACYYGDRETDLAMSELFGGFSPDFYDGYDQVWPRHPGYEQRRKLYQLYHVLNHANLFGGGYIEQSLKLMQQLYKS